MLLPDADTVNDAFCRAIEDDMKRKGETFPSLAEVTERVLSEPPWNEADLSRALNL